VKKLDLPIEQICKKYLIGTSIFELSKEYVCDRATIKNRLIDNDIKIRSIFEQHVKRRTGKNHFNYIDLPIEEISKKYLTGATISELAKEYGCSQPTIINRLKKSNIKIRSSWEIQSIDLPIESIIIEYENGASTVKIGKKYDCSHHTILKKLRKSGVKIRTSAKTNTRNLPMNDIIIDYENSMTTIQIGKKYNCCVTTISNKLKEYNIQIRSIKESLSIISTRVCIKCGCDFEGNSHTQLCLNCNESGYCYKWNNDCRENNRNKYNRECFFCGKSEEDNGIKLSVHHADYNKNQGCDNTPSWKLIPLCNQCHGITGGKIENRKLWEARILYLHKEYWR